MIPPVTRRMPDGRRLHMQHGPMDLIVHVDGPAAAVAAAETAATARFETILAELVPQLDVLRTPMDADHPPTVTGTVAARMCAAAGAFPDVWVTPMVAVAGSVAEEVCDVLASVEGVTSAYVNNGGDVALYLTPGAELRVGMVADLVTGHVDAILDVPGDGDVRGLATSGAGGRSHSLGIADAVTVVGTRTSVCDAAASLVANAVDLAGHPRIQRLPARELDPDSDLGEQLVTVEVPTLDAADVTAALDAGTAEAQRRLRTVPELRGVVLHLQGQRRVVGAPLAGQLRAPSQPDKEPVHAR